MHISRHRSHLRRGCSNLGPALDPKLDSVAPKPGHKDNMDINTPRSDPSAVGLKERHGGEEENSADSAADGLKSKKSVRWSQELVVGSLVPRDTDRESGNSYVDYPPAIAPADISLSFNFKGFNHCYARMTYAKQMLLSTLFQ